MNSKGLEFFDELIEIQNSEKSILNKYPKMRSLLERSCKDMTSEDPIQFSNLFSRLNYVCGKVKLSPGKKYRINTFRINANKVLHSEFIPNEPTYKIDYKSFCDIISIFYDTPIPKEHYKVFDGHEKHIASSQHEKEILTGKKFKRIRAIVTEIEQECLLCDFEEFPSEESYKVKINVGPNEFISYYGNLEFESTYNKIWKGASLNLIDVSESAGYFYAEYLVLEPDYLIDISSLAECHKIYGNHQLNYTISKLITLENKMHFRIGDFANQCLDEKVFESPNSNIIIAKDLRTACVKSYPVEYSTCIDFNEVNYVNETETQYLNISNVVSNSFPESNIVRNKATVEPSFFCEYFGIHGRLDFFQYLPDNGFYNIIELKSGKAPYPMEDLSLIGKNHIVQLYLYYLTVLYNLESTGVTKDNVNIYVLYSKYATGNLRYEKPDLSRLKRIINKRNQIVLIEHFIANNNNNPNSERIFEQITPRNLIHEVVPQKLLEQYCLPEINRFTNTFTNASSLENKYFHSLYSFVTKEQFLFKVGSSDNDRGNRGVSSLWQNDIQEKMESGEILIELSFNPLNNRVNDHKPLITFDIPDYYELFKEIVLPNFREGEIVNIYERNSDKDDVRNKQIFKGIIERISQEEVMIRLRFKQLNPHIFNAESKYAIEHDFIDSSYNSAYRGLYSFLQATNDRKDLLLGKRLPENDEILYNEIPLDTDYIFKVVSKAKAAKDYFLLMGPPGTGKTSVALKLMVEEFVKDTNNNILLMAYTNRAVDEICDTLDRVSGHPPFMRIGSELSCESKHRTKILNEIIKECNTREQVSSIIEKYKIFVGTTSSLSNKMELFKLKQFQVAIIDEASQILESNIIGLLSAKNSAGGNAINKFILIGDYKQLPAVVLQKEEDSKVIDVDLKKTVKLIDRRNSLFERLFSLIKENTSSCWDVLHKQGRMHPEIALFPNYSFYNSKLEVVPRPHQLASLPFSTFDRNNSIQKLLSTKRNVFIPSDVHNSDKTYKTNTHEANIVSELVMQLCYLCSLNGLDLVANDTNEDNKLSIGIITPYRSQIALIKRKLHELKIPLFNSIMVDTVERFQGSQRDIIIYSFSVNQFHQLKFLSSNSFLEEGQIIDRKLNVAITRAKKQLFIVGNPNILTGNLIYHRFIEFIRSKGGYIDTRPDQFIAGNFTIEEADIEIDIATKIYEPVKRFIDVFEDTVIGPLRNDPRTPKVEKWWNCILGNDSDFNRMNLIGYGRSDFTINQESLFGYSLADRVNLYCYYNMRKHYFSSVAIFGSFKDSFQSAFSNTQNRITFIDYGCGPLTSGLAFNHSFNDYPGFGFNYFGIDKSTAMLLKAKEFSETQLFNKNLKIQLVQSFDEIHSNTWDNYFTLPNTVILNFCYLFANLDADITKVIASQINTLMDKYLCNFIAVYQNSSIEIKNRNWHLFKKLVPRLNSFTQKTETIAYRNSYLQKYDKSEAIYYELLSNKAE